jgi:hypothetical protein
MVRGGPAEPGRQEGLAKPDNSDKLICLYKPPIFIGRCILWTGRSDAFLRQQCHSSTTAYFVHREQRQETHLVAQRKTASKKSGKARTATKAKAAKASPKTRAAFGRGSATSRKSAAGAREVTIDRRRKAGRRDKDEVSTAKSSVQPPIVERRKKVNRRRQIDPTTCERDYTDDEIQFMNALDDYKHTSGRMFPTCSEVLEVVRSLGYLKLSPGELAERHAVESTDQATPPSDWNAVAHEPEPMTV